MNETHQSQSGQPDYHYEDEDTIALRQFVISTVGQNFLHGIRKHLLNRVIKEVEFGLNGDYITTILILSGRENYAVNDEVLSLSALREQFPHVFRGFAEANPIDGGASHE